MYRVSITLLIVFMLLTCSVLVACGRTAEWYADRAYDLIYQGLYDEAIGEASKAIELNPDLAYAYVNRAWAYNETGRFNLAIADCDKAIELDPDFVIVALAYNNRAMAYLNVGQYNQTILDCNKAIEFDPGMANFYVNRACGYTFLGMDDEAGVDVEQAVALGFNRVSIETMIERIKQVR